MRMSNIRELHNNLVREGHSSIEEAYRQIDLSDVFVASSEVNVWKMYANELLEFRKTPEQAIKINLTMDLMKNLSNGQTLDDVIGLLSKDEAHSIAEKSFALRHAVKFSGAFEGRHAEVEQELMQRLEAVKEIGRAHV